MQTVCGKAPVASAMVRKNIIGLPCSLCQPTLWCRVVKNELVPPCSRVLSAVVLLLLLVSLTYKVCCYFQSTSCPFFQCFGCFMLCVQFRVCVSGFVMCRFSMVRSYFPTHSMCWKTLVLSSVHSCIFCYICSYLPCCLYQQPTCCNATVIKDLPNMGTHVH